MKMRRGHCTHHLIHSQGLLVIWVSNQMSKPSVPSRCNCKIMCLRIFQQIVMSLMSWWWRMIWSLLMGLTCRRLRAFLRKRQPPSKSSQAMEWTFSKALSCQGICLRQIWATSSIIKAIKSQLAWDSIGGSWVNTPRKVINSMTSSNRRVQSRIEYWCSIRS